MFSKHQRCTTKLRGMILVCDRKQLLVSTSDYPRGLVKRFNKQEALPVGALLERNVQYVQHLELAAIVITTCK